MVFKTTDLYLAEPIILGYPVASLLSYITWKTVAPPTGLSREHVLGYIQLPLLRHWCHM